MNTKLESLYFREHKAVKEEHVNLHHFEKDYKQS